MKKRHKVGIAAVVVGGAAAWFLSRKRRAKDAWQDTFSYTNRVKIEHNLKEARDTLERKVTGILGQQEP